MSEETKDVNEMIDDLMNICDDIVIFPCDGSHFHCSKEHEFIIEYNNELKFHRENKKRFTEEQRLHFTSLNSIVDYLVKLVGDDSIDELEKEKIYTDKIQQSIELNEKYDLGLYRFGKISFNEFKDRIQTSKNVGLHDRIFGK